MAVLAAAASLTGGAVEEVLLHGVAYVGAEFGGCAGDLAVGGGAGVGVVSLGVGAHEGFALEVAGCALAGCAGEGGGVAAGCACVILVQLSH